MSGHHTRLIDDACAICQHVEASTRKNRMHDFLIDKFENRLSGNAMAACGNKHEHIECKRCHQKSGCVDMHKCHNCGYNDDAHLDNTRAASLAHRLNVENDLMGLTRLLSNCDSKKYMPCDATNPQAYGNFVSRPNTCNNHRSIKQPLLCDRAINPTNMRAFTAWDKY